MVIIPARVRRPKDKAKVEGGVLIAERWLLAALRNVRFFCINELNDQLGTLLDKLNRTPFQKLEGSRHTVFESQERPVLLTLPVEPFVQMDFQRMRVPEDYYLNVDGHLYMVPYRLIGELVEVWTTLTLVEVCHRNLRVALHPRGKRGGRTVVTEFMPVAHREVASWTTERMVAWANKIGPETTRVIEAVVASRPHPEQAVNSCLGILRQAKKRGAEALEAACRRALAINSPTYRSVKSILDNNLHLQAIPAAEQPSKPPRKEHPNLRGSGYYQMTFGEEEQPAC
jgi:transposase